METIGLTIRVQKAFGNLHRPRCILIALGDSEKRILTGAKADYLPPAITRLIGGGMGEDEDGIEAAIREVEEETGITLASTQLVPLFTLRIAARDKDENDFFNKTHVYFADIGKQKCTPSDDISAIVPLTLDELYKMGEHYDNLQDFLWFKNGQHEFSWADYGKMYGIIHKRTAEKLRELLG